VESQADLFEVVYALKPPRGFTSRLNRGQQKRDENGNDCDHHEQLDQCECATSHRGVFLVS
jgi:hypothetical protein